MFLKNITLFQRLYSHHHSSFCKRFVRENRPLPHPYKSGHGIWQLCGKTSICYEYFGSTTLSLTLTLNPAFSGKPVNAYYFLNDFPFLTPARPMRPHPKSSIITGPGRGSVRVIGTNVLAYVRVANRNKNNKIINNFFTRYFPIEIFSFQLLRGQ